MSLRTAKIGLAAAFLLLAGPAPSSTQTGGEEFDAAAAELAKRYLEEGRETFASIPLAVKISGAASSSFTTP